MKQISFSEKNLVLRRCTKILLSLDVFRVGFILSFSCLHIIRLTFVLSF